MSERSWPANREVANTDAKDIDAFRRELLVSLPGLIDRAIRNYGHFAADQPPIDAKGFLAYQAGCRAAITHIHLLVKLADWARSTSAEESLAFGSDQLDRLVREAEVALRDTGIDEE